MLMTLLTVRGKPLNGGTLTRFIALLMHVPLDVPAKGGSLMVALATLPLGSNVTEIVTRPVGPPRSRHLAASRSAAASAVLAATGSKCWATPAVLPSLWRAPLANISAKPARVAADALLGGGTSAAREPRASPVGSGAAAVGSVVALLRSAGGLGAAAGSALMGAAAGGCSCAERVKKKIPAPSNSTSSSRPIISGARLFFSGQSGAALAAGWATTGAGLGLPNDCTGAAKGAAKVGAGTITGAGGNAGPGVGASGNCGAGCSGWRMGGEGGSGRPMPEIVG